MKKKILIGGIILAVLIIGIIGYFIFGTKNGTADGTTITSLRLESFPEGTQMGPGMTGTETTNIKIGEIVSLSGTAITDGSVDSLVKIFDAQNNLVQEQPCVKIQGSGGFGCSLNYPQIAGAYVLKFFVEGTEEKSFEFNGYGRVGSPACGDEMVMWLKIDPKKEIIRDCRWRTFGCGSAIASSSLATEWVKGKTLSEALAIKNTDIVKELSLPPVKIHCSVLAEDAIKAAINDWKKKHDSKD